MIGCALVPDALSQRIKALGKNKYFLIMMGATLTLAIYQTLNGTVATYYSQYVLGHNEFYSVLNLAENIPQIIVIMILAPFIKRFGKRNLALAGAIIAAAAQVLLMVQPDNFGCVLAAAALRGIGKAPFMGVVFTITADIINYGHWVTGVRVQALTFSASTVGMKFGGGIAGWLIGVLMEKSGFTGLVQEIPSAVSMVKGLYIYGSFITWVIIALFMFSYKLEKQYDTMMADMESKGMLQ